MNPIPVTTLLFINSLVQQCKHQNFLLKVHYIYWSGEGQQRMAVPLLGKMQFLAALHNSARLKTARGKSA
jgi:hypothetical protein